MLECIFMLDFLLVIELTVVYYLLPALLSWYLYGR